MAGIEIPEGHSVIAGRGIDNAKRALQAADEAGVSQYEVKTRPDGYLVPDAVADKYHELFDAELAEASEEIDEPAPAEPTPVVEEDETAPETPADVAPKGNASQDEWVAYGQTQPGWVEDDANLSRDELRSKYGPQK